MAIVHRATLTPHKFDLITRWLPGQPWFDGAGAIESVSSFRLDDPDGEVGIETFIVRSGGREFHVPVTYRGAPLPGGTLVGELEHSALGHRWVYDGPTDGVYVSTTTQTIVAAGHEVEMFLPDGTPVPRADTAASVAGAGLPDDVVAGELAVARLLPADVPAGAPRLDASWPGRDTVTLAWLV